MEEQEAALDILTIALGERMVGIDSEEIEKSVAGLDAGGRRDALLADYRSAGALLRLEELAGTAAGPGPAGSALVVRTARGRLLLTFNGAMDMKRLRLADISPAPEMLKTRQKPFVTWGFAAPAGGRQRDIIMLVTFQFMAGKG
jgi:hypothetical protein